MSKAQQFGEATQKKQRYIVVVSCEIRENRCEVEPHWATPIATCPVCWRRFCSEHASYQSSPHLGNRPLCEDCACLPIEEQLRIAQFAAELNK